MGQRTNHGSVGLRNGQPLVNGAALQQAGQQMFQQEMAVRQAQAVAKNMVYDTGKQIFALLACQLDVPAVGAPVDEVSLRHLAAYSFECAKYYAEALGWVTIEPPKAAEVSPETGITGESKPAESTEQPAAEESRIILP